MSYEEWFEAHALKHKQIVDRLVAQGYTQEHIVEYFRWENIKETDVDFCPLFAKNEKCHDMEDLNCYLCGCPNFRFDDDAPVIKSSCSVNSKNGSTIEVNGIIHQDCSGCLLPHKERFIHKYFDLDWKKVMGKAG